METTEPKQIKKSFSAEVLDFVRDICLILLAVFLIRTFFVMPFQINGQSMYESYYDRQFIIVDRFSYRDIPLIGQVREITRGDVVVFAPGVSHSRKYFIKRVIGLPGETIKLDGGRVYIKGVGEDDFVELDEGGYLSAKNNKRTTIKGSIDEVVYEIPEDRYYVMGDNRAHSTDSRTCFQSCSVRSEYISSSEVLGKVWFDMGYFNFKEFSFSHPTLDISTLPKAFSSLGTYEYE